MSYCIHVYCYRAVLHECNYTQKINAANVLIYVRTRVYLTKRIWFVFTKITLPCREIRQHKACV